MRIDTALRSAKPFMLFRPPLRTLKFTVRNQNACAGLKAECRFELPRRLFVYPCRQRIRDRRHASPDRYVTR